MAFTQKRINALQELLGTRAVLETNATIAEFLKDYDELMDSISTVRKQAINAIKKEDFNLAQRLIHQMDQQVTAWFMARSTTEQTAIMAIIEQAAIRGAQSVEIVTALAAKENASLNQLLSMLEQAASQVTGTGPILAPAITAVYGQVAQRVKDAIAKKVYQDGLNLSQRLHVRLAQNAVEFNRILTTGIQEGRAAVSIAKEIATLNITDPKLPRYLERLEAAVKGTSQESIAKAARRAITEMDKRLPGPLGLRGPVRKVIQAARTGSAEKLNAAIENFLKRKARYHAIVIARTEAQNAFRDAHVTQAMEAPYVVGIKWRLSRSHKRPCECENHAEQNRYGLGVGVFPPGELPERPHPNCFCFFTDVINFDFFFQAA